MRAEFLTAARDVFAPVLRADGFRGSVTKFRRVLGDVAHAIVVQGARGGGSACVELGIHFMFLPDALERPPDPKRITAYDCEFRWRLAPEGHHDFWWSYGETGDDAVASVRHLTETYVKVGAPAFGRWADFPGGLETVSPEQLDSGNLAGLPGRTNISGAALVMARTSLHLADRETARAYALVGLRHAGAATFLKRRLEAILDGTAIA